MAKPGFRPPVTLCSEISFSTAFAFTGDQNLGRQIPDPGATWPFRRGQWQIPIYRTLLLATRT